jgi:hypothetical protein
MSDAFYVGYLATPPATARRLKRIAGALVVLAAVAAAALAVATGPFDRSKYEYGTETSWQGKLEASPVPVLITATERLPLVAQGKHGADAMIAGLDGVSVRLKGKRIVRGATTMLEIVPGTIERYGTPAPASKIEDLGRATFSGEIVDSKCFLGVMNPGRLEVHRACAKRCIAGGIPPMLFVRDEQGREAHILLVDSNGQPLNDRVLGLVARPVTLTGRLERRDNLEYLYVDWGQVSH